MLKSMTAYASLTESGPAGVFTWEIRSVNHRYLDFQARLPEEFRALEAPLRDRVRQVLSRGKVDASLRFAQDPALTSAAPGLNRDLAQALIQRLGELEALAGGGQIDLVRLLQWPGVLIEPQPDLDEARAQALALFDRSLAMLDEARAREGEAIAEMIRARLDALGEQVEVLRAHLPEVRTAVARRLEQRLAELQVECEPGRVEQELALVLTRLDVDEELDRLEAHLAEIRRLLESDGPVGRRLDFMMQELNREANTLGSKTVSGTTSGAAVELKVLIEQMREQIQNVE